VLALNKEILYFFALHIILYFDKKKNYFGFFIGISTVSAEKLL